MKLHLCRAGFIVCLAFATFGCASVQRAVIGPMIDLSAAQSPTASSTAVANSAVSPTTVPTPEVAESSHFIFRPGTSQLRVVSGDLFGNYPSQVTRYRGRLTLARESSGQPHRIDITFDMTSIHASIPGVTAALQYDFLEIDSYPDAHFEATLRPTNAVPEEVMVDGNLELHGQRRRVTFKGRLHRDGSEYLFTSTFDLDRHAFDIRRRDMWDWAAKNDFQVSMAMRGTPEKVRAEEVP